MTIASYSDMQALIARRMRRSDLTSNIPDYIALAETRIYREMKLRQMETTFTDTIASGTIAVPSSYSELKYAYVVGSPNMPLARKDSEWINANYPTRAASGIPHFIARDGETFIFGPYPDSAYTINGTYYKRLAALSDTNTSNWLITDAPDLLMYAAMVEGGHDIRDEALIQFAEQKYQQVKDRVEQQNIEEELSGSPLAATAR